MTTTDAEYLAALPPTVQQQLLMLVEAAADTTDDEKVVLMSWITNGIEGMLRNPLIFREHAKLIALLGPVGELLAEIYRADEQEVA
ncbi:hypothetical protein QI633_11280 [Nocardioides sp. QY071]|uniref:hypothetical protein n=1 Tax=Nocardioides sp. QY071 TaxID=3044187 RepID=UPI00249CEC35|nr:hypothetical protein [Nocardioides sp. QY071]WGY04328.1 hypothetical protein QI633_11280 [Nocardioides sp. QY071]